MGSIYEYCFLWCDVQWFSYCREASSPKMWSPKMCDHQGYRMITSLFTIMHEEYFKCRSYLCSIMSSEQTHSTIDTCREYIVIELAASRIDAITDYSPPSSFFLIPHSSFRACCLNAGCSCMMLSALCTSSRATKKREERQGREQQRSFVCLSQKYSRFKWRRSLSVLAPTLMQFSYNVCRLCLALLWRFVFVK